MKRHLLLAMLLLFSMALLGTNNIYATTPNQQNSEITANTSFVSESTAGVGQDVNETSNIQNTTVRNLNEVQTVNNTTKNLQTTITVITVTLITARIIQLKFRTHHRQQEM